MPRALGAKGRNAAAIRDAIGMAFERVNGGGKYLDFLATDHPALFVALVAKVLPAAVAIDLNITGVDLGKAMADARARLAQRDGDGATVIDVTPEPEPEPEPASAVIKRTKRGQIA